MKRTAAHLQRFPGHLQGALPELIKFAWLVCYSLCKFTGTDFKSPVIGVAAENISMKDFEALS